ncbi:hypothetical protein CEXT_302521 [Caerostris extrusa]|uniref:Uncharacterized protein n=1 Tax=Caerostris extrusa TaxID=172846 RepID=A0AAV4M9V4_CAEEX|nr:hypothetical protein CEXT_302521 [Caerostris extrusa]
MSFAASLANPESFFDSKRNAGIDVQQERATRTPLPNHASYKSGFRGALYGPALGPLLNCGGSGISSDDDWLILTLLHSSTHPKENFTIYGFILPLAA